MDRSPIASGARRLSRRVRARFKSVNDAHALPFCPSATRFVEVGTKGGAVVAGQAAAAGQCRTSRFCGRLGTLTAVPAAAASRKKDGAEVGDGGRSSAGGGGGDRDDVEGWTCDSCGGGGLEERATVARAPPPPAAAIRDSGWGCGGGDGGSGGGMAVGGPGRAHGATGGKGDGDREKTNADGVLLFLHGSYCRLAVGGGADTRSDSATSAHRPSSSPPPSPAQVHFLGPKGRPERLGGPRQWREVSGGGG